MRTNGGRPQSDVSASIRRGLGSLLFAASALIAACSDSTPPDQPENPVGPLQIWIRYTGLVLEPAAQFAMEATVYDENSPSLLHRFPGNIGDPWPDTLRIRWTTSDGERVRVNQSAVLTAAGEGSATIRVDVEGYVDSAAVTVSADPPATHAYAVVSAGWSSTCATDLDKQAWCWGSDWMGALGRGTARTFTIAATPGPVVGSHRFDSIVVGGTTGCGITDGGATYCWGRGDRAQLGNGTDGFVGPYLSGSAEPDRVAADPRFVAIALGSFHGCGLTEDGKAHCWGSAVSGAAGAVGSDNVTEPAPVDTEVAFTALVAGAAHTCALTSGGEAYCWGSNDGGQLGNDSLLEPCGGGLPCRTVPLAVTGDLAFTALSAGSQFTCGIAHDEMTYCWGSNVDGQVGQTEEAIFPGPVPVTNSPALAVLASGGFHTCGLTASGEAHCWGANRRGQLGNGERNFIPNPTPAPVAGSLTFARIASGLQHTCGITPDDAIYCWGSNASGQLGDGLPQQAVSVPVRVLDPQQPHAGTAKRAFP
jgi:alpha-tubulin suppressor-like RCC1 family protein